MRDNRGKYVCMSASGTLADDPIKVTRECQQGSGLVTMGRRYLCQLQQAASAAAANTTTAATAATKWVVDPEWATNPDRDENNIVYVPANAVRGAVNTGVAAVSGAVNTGAAVVGAGPPAPAVNAAGPPAPAVNAAGPPAQAPQGAGTPAQAPQGAGTPAQAPQGAGTPAQAQVLDKRILDALAAKAKEDAEELAKKQKEADEKHAASMKAKEAMTQKLFAETAKYQEVMKKLTENVTDAEKKRDAVYNELKRIQTTVSTPNADDIQRLTIALANADNTVRTADAIYMKEMEKIRAEINQTVEKMNLEQLTLDAAEESANVSLQKAEQQNKENTTVFNRILNRFQGLFGWGYPAADDAQAAQAPAAAGDTQAAQAPASAGDAQAAQAPAAADDTQAAQDDDADQETDEEKARRIATHAYSIRGTDAGPAIPPEGRAWRCFAKNGGIQCDKIGVWRPTKGDALCAKKHAKLGNKKRTMTTRAERKYLIGTP